MPWGTHFCHFYDSNQDLLDTLVPYFKAGLEDKEFCIWVIAAPLTKEEACNALQLAVPDLDRHFADRSIEMFLGEEWYLKNDTFNLDRVTNAWNKKLKQALARGYEGMRVSGDTCWLRKKDSQDFCAYENQLNESISDQAITVLCTYQLAKSGAAEISGRGACASVLFGQTKWKLGSYRDTGDQAGQTGAEETQRRT